MCAGPEALAAAAEQQEPLVHAHEVVVCPAEDDELRSQKLALMSVTGLGLAHWLTWRQGGQQKDATAPLPQVMQPHQQQQQQQQPLPLDQTGHQLQAALERALTGMAVAMCDNNQLLAPERIYTVVTQLSSQLDRATRGAASAVVSATAAMQVDATPASVGHARDVPECSGEKSWNDLRAELLRHHERACHKQLARALRAELRSARAATLMVQEEAVDGDCGDRHDKAMVGVHVYLSGLVKLLETALGVLEAMRPSTNKRSRGSDA